MKHHIQIKQSEHVQVGHLYEHLYCHQLSQLFRKKGLFAYVDYSIDGRTYYDGVVEIEIILYTKSALEYGHLIKTFKIKYDEDIISGGLLQIMAEKRVDVWERDDELIEKKLENLNSLSWTLINKKHEFKIKSDLRNGNGLVFEEKTQRSFLNMKQKIVFNKNQFTKDSKSATAIFYIIAMVLRENLQEELAQSLYYYSVKNSLTRNDSLLIDTNTYRVDRRQATVLTNEGEIVQMLLKKMYERNFVERLSEFITTSSSTEEVYGLPSNDTLRKVVGVTMSDDEWHKAGSKDMIKSVLKSLSIELKLGQSVEVISLS